jgi:L-alanine-DL-glutamate epimerase-like enolase superfamily enzyme
MEATLYQQDVVLDRRVQASEQDHRERVRIFLRLEHEGVSGFGEVSPQPYSLNGDPGIADVRDALDAALTQLEDIIEREGELPLWSRVARLGNETPPRRVASALLEMAILDRELRAASRSIEEMWPMEFVTPTQSTVSLLDENTEWLVDPLSQRVRAKTGTGPISTFSLERLSTLSAPVLLDFNCSASDDDDVLAQVAQARRVCVVSAIEQPYAVGNLVDHARLAEKLDVDLSLDEGVRTLRDVGHIVRYSAASMLCVKPARVGGLANARTIIERARSLGLRAYVGGFFESPYARHVHRALANCSTDEPSDVGDIALAEVSDEVQWTDTSFGVEPSLSMLERATPLSVLRTGEP